MALQEATYFQSIGNEELTHLSFPKQKNKTEIGVQKFPGSAQLSTVWLH